MQAHLLHLDTRKLDLFPRTHCADERLVTQISLTNTKTYEAWCPLHNTLHDVFHSYKVLQMGWALFWHLDSQYIPEGKLGKKWSDSIIYKGLSQETSPNILSLRGTGCGSCPILWKHCCVLTLMRPLFINIWGLWASAALQQLSLRQKFINFSMQHPCIAVLSHSLITQVVWSSQDITTGRI